MRRLPPLTAIEAFVQVAREGSVKAAAEKLSLSSPALSRRVQALERFVGMPLFDRRHQAMVLNSEGGKLLDGISPALDMLTDAIENATGARQGILRLRLAVPPLFASQRIMPILSDLRNEHPDLHLDLITSVNGLARLTDGIDAAIVLARDVEDSLYARRIERGKIVLLGSPHLIDELGRPFQPRDVEKLTVLLHDDLRDSFDVWRDAIGMPDLEPMTIDYFDSGQLILDAAAAGLGVAFMMDGHMSSAHSDNLIMLSDTQIASPHSYWFACRRSALSNRAVKLFHDWLFAALPADT